jgi:glucoamylase
MEFANAYLKNGGSLTTVQSKIWDSTNNPTVAPVQKDLLFVARNWSYPSFDLWEEESSAHFYTRMVQRRALIMGVAFAKKMGDTATANTLNAAIAPLTNSFEPFWDSRRNLILYEYGPVLLNKASYKDIAVVLAVLHGYAGDDFYGPTDDRVVASAYEVATSFLPVYAVANITKDAQGQVLGIPVG